MAKRDTRIERDSMGDLAVPADALYAAQTQRAIQNFAISDLRLPPAFIHSICLIKAAAAHVNLQLGLLAKPIALAIQAAADVVRSGGCDDQFPIDVFQTGSGTSTNMNVNEVLATLATRSVAASSATASSATATSAAAPVDPNDHVNMSQSSNDVIPTAIHLSAALALHTALLPALAHLADTLRTKAAAVADVVKTGRTHLMDAMPITFGQELGGWEAQIRSGIDRLVSVQARLHLLPQGGTAVGTGVNAHPEFAARIAARLSDMTGLTLRQSPNFFEALGSQDTAVELSGQLKVIAGSIMKIANDLRWMNSGPLAGLAEIELPALQPGSSIMPGKVNPVIPEAATMVAAQVIGNDATITIGGQSGNFQLNVMLPVIAYNLLQSIDLLANVARALADQTIAGFTIHRDNVDRALARNPILVTALNTLIGYKKAAEIAKIAYRDGRPIIDVAAEMTNIERTELERLLDPRQLTLGGLPK